jgi:hypothetical protein
MDKKRHHYVPKAYLNAFCDDAKKLRVYLKDEPDKVLQAPRCTFTIDVDQPIADQSKALLLACSKGEISPETFRLLMDCLSAYIGMKDVETVVAELKALSKNRIPGGVVII